MTDVTETTRSSSGAPALVRRVVRFVGGAMVVAGVLGIVWVSTVWLWQDPFTALYTHLQQNKLASRYEERVRQFVAQPPLVAPGPTVADEKRAVATAARLYRLASHEGEALGRIHIPRIGLSMILVDGTATESLKKGPGRDLRTFLPGEGRLVYVAGHRTTYLAPFSHIDAMRAGDIVTIELPYAAIVYRVTGHVIVPATDLGRLESHGNEVLALQACHPRFFASHRYIVYAKPVRVIPRVGKAYTLG